MSPEPISRRRFLGASAAAVAALGGGTVFATTRAHGQRLRYGLMLFSLDADLRADLAGTLRRVREIGYRNVELFGLYGQSGHKLRELLHSLGLHCVSTHIRPTPFTPDMPSLQSNLDAQLAECRDLGLRYIVCPGPWLPERVVRKLAAGPLTKASVVAAINEFTVDDWEQGAALVNTAARKVRDHGMTLLYHNANMEFRTGADGSGFDVLLKRLDRALVEFELDCGWIQAAGLDPTAYLAKLAGRVPLVHFKDMKATPANTKLEINSTEIGTGIVDWPALIRAAEQAGTRYAFLEQEAPFTRPPLESARVNLEYLEHLSR
jgi:sugar phosphate isomerase/epimerase